MAYQIAGREVLYAWLEGETDSARREAMLAFMAPLAEDPEFDAIRVPGNRAQVFWRPAPSVPEVIVTYLVAHEYHVVRLLAITDIDDDV